MLPALLMSPILKGLEVHRFFAKGFVPRQAGGFGNSVNIATPSRPASFLSFFVSLAAVSRALGWPFPVGLILARPQGPCELQDKERASQQAPSKIYPPPQMIPKDSCPSSWLVKRPSKAPSKI